MSSNKPAFMVYGTVVKRGLLRPKIAEVTITDGVNEWKFDTAETFTIPELKARFPYFYRKVKK